MLPDLLSTVSTHRLSSPIDDFYNKPFGVRHFLTFARPAIPEDMVLALLDPDMIMMRPITREVAGLDNKLFNTNGQFGVK